VTDDPIRTSEPAGDGLLEPHGLEDVGEAIVGVNGEQPREQPGEPPLPAAVEPPTVVEAPVAPVEEVASAEAESEAAEAPGTPETPDAAPGTEDAPAPETPEAAAAVAQPTPRTVGRLVADTLRSAGVKFAFGVPGESFLGLLDGFADVGIRVVATRHESGAAFMAEAYGQLTGRPAACLGTRAVGAANLAIGIHTARADSTPMFALVGDVEHAVRGREAFQEVDLAATVGGLAAWAGRIDDPSRAAPVLAEAIRHAVAGRPGPALIACPEDVLDAEAPEAAVPIARPPLTRPDPSAVRAVIRLLAAAERPAILAGAGVLRARCSRELVRLADLLRVPVVASWRRGDVFPNDHPLYLGMSGYFAAPSARERLESADALLVLGCRLNEPTSLGYVVPRAGSRWALVDIDTAGWAARERDPDVTISSDAGAFLRAAVARLEGGVLDAEVADRRRAANDEARARYEATTVVDRGEWTGPGVHPGRVVAALRDALPDDAILTTDAGNFGGWLARGFRFRRPATFLGPTSGAMGYALPSAIAAAIVHRDRPVVAVAGDGGFAMTMVELETAVRERVHPIVLVFDNERYGTIRMHQDRRGPGGLATDLGPIDFVRLAEALGARGVRVDTTEAFEPALRAALDATVPTVIHLPLDRSWVSVDQTPV
jgi:acetolactate synthase-1/2/3 large subunit